jgi:hypothetical protein
MYSSLPDMKTFSGSWIYRGANFIVRFGAKSVREAAKMAGESEYRIKNYYSVVKERDVEYDGIVAEPYGSRTVIDYGFGKKDVFFENFFVMEAEIDQRADEYWAEARKEWTSFRC